MKNKIIQGLDEILKMPEEQFNKEYRIPAFEKKQELFGQGAYLTGVLALGNYCVNSCRYCGLRAESDVKRFRLSKQQLRNGIDYLESLGLNRVFLISGEDPKHDLDEINEIIAYAFKKDFYVTIGAGVFTKEEVKQLYDSGAREFCLKFETSNRTLFKAVKPRSDFDARIKCINHAVEAGFDIATGSIIGLENESFEDIVNDFKYTLTFNPSWIPMVPYLPAPGTPMAETTPPGDIELTLRLISLYRLMLPESRITAGQPAKGSKLGFADPAGNAAAVSAGANSFFIDATPAVVREDFSIVGGRALAAFENIKTIFRDNDLKLIDGVNSLKDL